MITPLCFFYNTNQCQWTFWQKVHFENVIKWLTSNYTHLLWQTDIVDFYLGCSTLWHQNKSLLDITRWEWRAYNLWFKNFDINWMKPRTRQVLAVEIVSDVKSYKVEIYMNHKCILEKEEHPLPTTSWLLQRWSLGLHRCLQARKTWHDELSAEVNVQVFALPSEKLIGKFLPDWFLQVRNYFQ